MASTSDGWNGKADMRGGISKIKIGSRPKESRRLKIARGRGGAGGGTG